MNGSPPEARLHPAFRVLLYLVLHFVLQGLFTGLVLLAAWASGTHPAMELLLTAYLLYGPGLLLLTAGLLRWLDRRRLTDIGVRWPGGGRRTVVGRGLAAAGLTTALLGLWFAALLSLNALRVWGLSPEFRAHGSGVLVLVGLLLLFLVQGAAEELAFRGYILRALTERWSFAVAAGVQAVLFSLLHLLNGVPSASGALNTFLIGVIAALLVRWRGSLWAASIAHGVWNFVVACLISLPVSGFELFALLDVEPTGHPLVTGGAYGPEGSLLLTPLLLLAGLWVLRRVRASEPV